MPRGRSRGRRTDYSWKGVTDIVNAIDIGDASAYLGTFSILSTPATLMRVRGQVYVQLDPAAVDERATILCGIGVFTEDAVAAGVAPEFTTNGGDEEFGGWLWTGALFVSSGAGTLLDTTASGFTFAAHLEIDSKAMRRLKPQDRVAFVFQAPAVGAQDQGGTLDLMVQYRCLLGT